MAVGVNWLINGLRNKKLPHHHKIEKVGQLIRIDRFELTVFNPFSNDVAKIFNRCLVIAGHHLPDFLFAGTD